MPDRDAIRARADAATPGPWRAESIEGELYVTGGNGCALWNTRGDMRWTHDFKPGPAFNRIARQGDADAAFIAHAREDIPALLAALATAEAERAIAIEAFAICREQRNEEEARADAAERRAERAEAFLRDLREAAGGSEKLCALMLAGRMRILNGEALARAHEGAT